MSGIDQIDERILRVLSVDGRISNVDLAARVGLSPSANLRRVQALEKGLEAQLFLRTAAGFTLTEAGRLLLPQAPSCSSTPPLTA